MARRVQAEAAPAAYRSWRAGILVADTSSTFAEGLATRTAFELPQQILRRLLDDFVLVSEDRIRTATRVCTSHADCRTPASACHSPRLWSG
jgi:threonine dehydratase